MKSKNNLFTHILPLAIVLSLLSNYAVCPVTLAAAMTELDFSDLAKLKSMETIIYGSSYTSLPSDRRINSLERIIFGKTHHKGSLHTRIIILATAISGGQNNLLAPPLAPELDHSDHTIHSSVPPVARTADNPLNDDVLTPGQARQDRIKGMLQQAMQLYGQGQTTQAEASFEKVLALDSQNSDANFNLGAIAEGRSSWAIALMYYQAALKSNPSDQDTKNAIAAMQAKLAAVPKNLAKTNDSSTHKLSNEQLDSLKAKVNEAASDYQKGNYDAAINTLQAVVAQAPNEADVYYALAQAYKAKGEYRQAGLALSQASKLAPDNEEYKNALFDLGEQTANAPGDNANDTFANNNPQLGRESGKNTLANQNTSDASSPTGQITPFSDDSNSQTGWQPTGGGEYYGGGNYGVGTSYYAPSLISSYTPGYAYSNYMSPNMTYRIERAAIGGLAGAAIGSMFSGYGMHSRGAMTGAMMGSMFGFMSGGGRRR